MRLVGLLKEVINFLLLISIQNQNEFNHCDTIHWLRKGMNAPPSCFANGRFKTKLKVKSKNKTKGVKQLSSASYDGAATWWPLWPPSYSIFFFRVFLPLPRVDRVRHLLNDIYIKARLLIRIQSKLIMAGSVQGINFSLPHTTGR